MRRPSRGVAGAALPCGLDDLAWTAACQPPARGPRRRHDAASVAWRSRRRVLGLGDETRPVRDGLGTRRPCVPARVGAGHRSGPCAGAGRCARGHTV